MTWPPLRIAKVGGSLLEFPDLPVALQQWLAGQRTDHTACVMLVGGGVLADFIRQADQRFGIGAEAGHWLCVNLLSVSAKLLAELLPQTVFVGCLDTLRDQLHLRSGGVYVFDASDFLKHDESELPGRPLPRDWRTTSDSIAARLAVALAAQELVLLKSVDAETGLSRQSAADRGLVDCFFPVAAATLNSVRWVNLRNGAETKMS